MSYDEARRTAAHRDGAGLGQVNSGGQGSLSNKREGRDRQGTPPRRLSVLNGHPGEEMLEPTASGGFRLIAAAQFFRASGPSRPVAVTRIMR